MRQGDEIMQLFKLNNDGTPIVQVSHSERYAEYSDRIIELQDGWVASGAVADAPEVASS